MSDSSLKAKLGKATRETLKQQVGKVKDPFFESERVLLADNQKIIWDIVEHVKNCSDVFVTKDSINFAPQVPQGLDLSFKVPIEITAPRVRPYVLDRDGILRELDIEVRQEMKLGNKIVQTTKIGKSGNKCDSTMDRWEQKTSLNSKEFGFNVYAVGDELARRAILESDMDYPKIVQILTSQRIRIAYHPEGNKDVEIELALEPIHYGQTFTGYAWNTHKIDIEIKQGPPNENQAMRHSILAREEDRLLSLFPSLRRQLVSSASPGFDAVMEDLTKPKYKAEFDKMSPNQQWWLKRQDRPLPAELIAA